MFSKFSDHYPTAKELLSELVKMVMVVPFSDKVVAAQPEDTAEPDVMVIEEEAAVDNKPKDTEVIHSCQKQCCGAGPMLTGSGSCSGLQIKKFGYTNLNKKYSLENNVTFLNVYRYWYLTIFLSIGVQID